MCRKPLKSNGVGCFGQRGKDDCKMKILEKSAPGLSRTADQRFRKPLLYPSELRGHCAPKMPEKHLKCNVDEMITTSRTPHLTI